jgi:transposase
MATSQTKVEQIKAMFKNGYTEREICESVGVSRNTARKYKPKKNEQRQLDNEQFEQKVDNIINERNNTWLDRLRKDNRQERATDFILNILNDESTMKNELKKNGIRNIITAYRVLAETGIKLSQHHNNPTGQTTHIENNVSEIIKMIKEPTETIIDPMQEIEEFKKDNVQ